MLFLATTGVKGLSHQFPVACRKRIISIPVLPLLSSSQTNEVSVLNR